MKPNQIICGDNVEVLKTFPDESIQCCVTSPPYWGLRDYGVDGQLGLEKTPEEYIEKIVGIFREVKRILKVDGTLWLNLGDSYATGTTTQRQPGNQGLGLQNDAREARDIKRIGTPIGLKTKDLVGIPWRVALGLQADGWYLRQDIIWHKPNPMPESVTDRCTKSHEYIFLLSKSAKYYYDHDAIKEPLAESSIQRLSQNIATQDGSKRVPGKINGNMKAVRPHGITRDRLLNYNSKEKKLRPNVARGGFDNEHELPEPSILRNKRSVWTITTKPYKKAHFATFPPKLIEPCILAGCPKDGIVLDPFMGAGTTALVSRENNRNFIGIELNKEYCKIAEQRISQAQLNLF